MIVGVSRHFWREIEISWGFLDNLDFQKCRLFTEVDVSWHFLTNVEIYISADLWLLHFWKEVYISWGFDFQKSRVIDVSRHFSVQLEIYISDRSMILNLSGEKFNNLHFQRSIFLERNHILTFLERNVDLHFLLDLCLSTLLVFLDISGEKLTFLEVSWTNREKRDKR